MTELDGADADLEELSYQECMYLLGTAQVGRLAVVVGHYPQVFPVNYRLDGSTVVFRTHIGTKLLAAHHQNVGFEVDYLDPVARSGWSVLIQGMAEDVTDREADPVTDRTRAAGVEPWTGGDNPRLVRIIPAKTTGRRIAHHEMDWQDTRGYL
jgi:hypothetical protein